MNKRYTFGQFRATKDNNSFEFILSSSKRDRHRTVLNQQNWNLDNYKRNPIVYYSHNDWEATKDPDYIIGRGDVWIENGILVGSVTLQSKETNQLARKIADKLNEGIPLAASVGFIPTGKGKYGEGEEARGAENETYYFAGQELLEWSIVAIPSNPDSIKRHFELDNNQRNLIRSKSDYLQITNLNRVI